MVNLLVCKLFTVNNLPVESLKTLAACSCYNRVQGAPITHRIQRCSQEPRKHLRWKALQQKLTAKGR